MRATLLGLLLLPASLAGAQQKPLTAGKSGGTNIGDIHIDFYKRIETNALHFSRMTFVGPGIVIEPRDRNRPTQFRLAADRIVGYRVSVGKRTFARAELSGNFHYTLTQHLKGEIRQVTGTAGSATYDQQTEEIHLNGGVAATLTDPVGLEGPARLRAGSMMLPTAPGREYVLSGTPDQNDLAFTPRRPAKHKTAQGISEKTPPVSGGFSGSIHLSQFRTGALLPNRTARAEGTNTLMEIAALPAEGGADKPVAPAESPQERHQTGRVMATSLTVGYAPGTRHYEARGNVRYHLVQADDHGMLQSVTGRSDSVAYDSAEERLTLDGAVEATLEDPATLMHPARLRAERAVMLRLPMPVGKGGKPQPPLYRYTLEGGVSRALLEFEPRPRLAATSSGKPTASLPNAAPQPTQAMTAGSMQITRFTQGEFVAGRNVEFTGNGVTFATTDSEKHSSARIQGRRLAARFADDRTLDRMTATGSVRFAIVQPVGETLQMQNITGSGSEAAFAVTDAGQTVTLQGPLEVRVDSPLTEAPALITDTDRRGRIIYNLTSSDLKQDTPNGTGRVQFVPRARKSAPATKGKASKAAKSTRNTQKIEKQQPKQGNSKGNSGI